VINKELSINITLGPKADSPTRIIFLALIAIGEGLLSDRFYHIPAITDFSFMFFYVFAVAIIWPSYFLLSKDTRPFRFCTYYAYFAAAFFFLSFIASASIDLSAFRKLKMCPQCVYDMPTWGIFSTLLMIALVLLPCAATARTLYVIKHTPLLHDKYMHRLR